MNELQKLCNIGPEIAKQLVEAGIHTYDDLANIGSCEAWLRIKAIDPSACVNRLMSLEGAIQNIRWHNLLEADKVRLKEFYKENK